PGATLNFQLANNMRLGATAYFHTTSIRSTWQIFSALESIKMAAARVGSSVVGMPLKMVLAPFRSNHNGIAAIQYGVSIELRAEDMKQLGGKFNEFAWTPAALGPAHRLIEATPEEVVIDPVISAPAMAAEFYPESFEDDEPAEDTSAGAAAATQA